MTTKLLHVSASPRGPHSLTRRLGAELVDRLTARHPDLAVTHRDLVAEPLPHLDGPVVAAMFTRPENRDPALAAAIALSDALVDELAAADLVVIEAPMFNWSVPSALKAWIDHIVRIGRTFQMPEAGASFRGLLSDRPVYVVVASGDVYTDGARGREDFLTPYLTHVLGFMGLKDLRFAHAEGVVVSADEALGAGRRQLAALAL